MKPTQLLLLVLVGATGCSSEASEQRMVCLPAASTCPSRADALDQVTRKNGCESRRSDIKVDDGPVTTTAGCCYLVTVTSREPDLDVCISSSSGRPLHVEGRARVAEVVRPGDWR